MVWKYVLAWFPLILVAIANGALREMIYKPYAGDLAAHQISTATFVFFFAAYVWAIGRRWKIESAGQSWLIGVIWVCMTIGFEFGFGHYVMGHAWTKLLHDYNILEGRVWIVVLVATLIVPNLSYRLHAKS